MKKIVFFRNDDVRESIDKELIELIEIFLAAKVPISLAVEPANVSNEVVFWLLDLKNKYSDLIEIIQHGYDHNKNLKYPKGSEFGKSRDFDSQYNDIEKGKQLMNKYFRDLWFPAMSFPYGSFNSYSLDALDKLNFKVLTTGIDFSIKHRIKNFVGRLLAKNFILGKKVSYHNQIRKNYNFLEIDISVSVIKKYISRNQVEHYSFNELIKEIENCSKYTSIIGILFHHRFHRDQLTEIRKMVDWLKNNDYEFSTLEKLHFKYQN
jgi:hypothetical protein